MFFLGALVFVVALVAAGVFHQQGSDEHLTACLGASGVGLALVLPSILAWIAHPAAIRDYRSGGYLELRVEPKRIAWVDWSPLWTRVGEIEGGRMRLTRSTLCGLIPLGHVDRPITDFYRLSVEMREESHHHHYGASTSGTDAVDLAYDLLSGRPAGYDGWGFYTDHVTGFCYRVSLVDRHANEVTLLTLREGSWTSGPGEAAIGRLREEMVTLLNLPDRIMMGAGLKHPVKNTGVSGPEAAPEAAPHVAGNVCPNCHRRYPQYVKSCPVCKVAVFED